MSYFVKGCRTPAVAARLSCARVAGVGQASGEETAIGHTRRISERVLWGFEYRSADLPGHVRRSAAAIVGFGTGRRRRLIADAVDFCD